MSSESVGDLLREIDDEREEARHWLREFNRVAKDNERLRAVMQEQATWLRKRGAELDEYVTTQHDYYERAEVLEHALKGEK